MAQSFLINQTIEKLNKFSIDIYYGQMKRKFTKTETEKIAIYSSADTWHINRNGYRYKYIYSCMMRRGQRKNKIRLHFIIKLPKKWITRRGICKDSQTDRQTLRAVTTVCSHHSHTHSFIHSLSHSYIHLFICHTAVAVK